MKNLKDVLLKKETIIAIVVLIIVAVVGVFGFTGEDIVSNENDNVIQGNLKTGEIDLNSKMAGLVEDVLVEEGDEVKAGDIIARIDNETILAKKAQTEATINAAQSQAEVAKAAQSAAKAQLEKAINGARSEDIAAAKAAYELAEKTYERLKPLAEEGAVSEMTLDESKAKYEGYKAQYEMALNGARSEDIAMAQAAVEQASATVTTAQASVEQAKGGLLEVETYLEDCIIKAPTDGVITTINVSEGELVSTGMPLVTIGGTAVPWVELNVKETDLSKVEKGATVKVEMPAYEGEIFEGTITTVNKKPDFATKKATNNNGEFDVLSYGVKIEIDTKGKTLYSGMTVFVDLE